MEALEINRASFRDFLNVIFKRRYQFLLFFILAFTVFAATTFMVKPVYEASVRILIKTDRDGIYLPTKDSGNLVFSLNREEQINSEVEILKSISLAKEVVTLLGATSIYPEFDKPNRGVLASILPTGNSKQTPTEKAWMALHKQLKIRGLNKSNVINVSFRHHDPRTAADVINTLANLYLGRHVDVHETSHSYEFYLEQSKFLKDKLIQAEAKLEQLKHSPTDANLEEQQNILLQHTHDLRIAMHELNKIEESRISDAVDSQKMTRVSLIEAAQVPLRPVSPKIFLNLLLGLCIGALVGLGVAVCLHFLDDSLESVEDVEETLDVPVLISIPYDKKERT